MIGNLSYRKTKNYKLINTIAKRLSRINQRTESENVPLSLKIAAVALSVGLVYFAFCISIFHELWYHKLIALAATLIIIKTTLELILEVIENRFKKKLPQMIRIFGYYYRHYNGNINKAMDASIDRTRDENKIYLQKIKIAINKEDYIQEMEYLKKNMPSVWLKLLCNLVIFAKRDGDKDAIAPNLNKLTYIINFVNLSQGQNNVEFLWIEVGLLVLPLIVIPFTQMYNGIILEAMEYENIYLGLEAQTKASLILLTSILSAMVVNWIRKVK
ncbi:MAG TPA: hypothetical protein DCP90_08575 [Clostridiales bacterium]|nr:MAG: hypothetical protein A2Y22_05850 [Clostridiales bacterium GWD2_32_59]HAN10648.1 hypothetical protein [Clostridiales bacterium]